MGVFRNFTKIILVVLGVLVIPWCGTLISDEVHWTIFDFVVAGVLLLSCGLLIDNLYRYLPTNSTKIGGIIFAIVAFVLLWLELAVGIFGSPIAGQ